VTQIERTLLIADLSGYTALTETHGALHASEVVLRFNRIAEASIEPGVAIIDRIGDQVLCASADTHAVLRSALRLCAAVEREPDFLAVQAGIHRGEVVERSGRLFGAPVNLTARLAGHARGGQILCTEPVAAAARGHPGVESHFVGERRFKNVPVAVSVYELMRASRAGPSLEVDPVCRMRLESRAVAATTTHLGMTYHFCSHECARLFREAPDVYARLWG
jgi:class 3 adenylate cyclase/YHS domain-containing protein